MKATRATEAILHEIGFRTVVCSPFRDHKVELFENMDVRPLTPELRSSDLLITFGGDGTILHLAKLAALNKIPVLGINMGSLGFIAELEASELGKLRKLQNWKFEMESRMMLDVTVIRDGKQIYANLGLNDAVVREGPISHVIHLSIASDGHHLADISGDGVIIATPTGSTAYSLSAGGPVVEPVAQAMVVCPICTHNMRFSSYVLSPEHMLSISIMRNGRKPVYLCVDESRAFPLKQDDRVCVRKSKYVTRLVRLSEKSFCEIFAKKMLPGGQEDEKRSAEYDFGDYLQGEYRNTGAAPASLAGTGDPQHPSNHIKRHQADAPHQGTSRTGRLQVRGIRQSDKIELCRKTSNDFQGKHHQH